MKDKTVSTNCLNSKCKSLVTLGGPTTFYYGCAEGIEDWDKCTKARAIINRQREEFNNVINYKYIQMAEKLILDNSAIREEKILRGNISYRILSPRNFGNLIDEIVKLYRRIGELSEREWNE